MPEKLEILYPRKDAILRQTDFSKEEAKLDKEIKEFEESEAFTKYKRLLKMKYILDSEKDYFRCWNCGSEQQTKNLILYNFVSFSRGPDENRYEDHNIICPSCGKFSCVRKHTHRFKEIKEIYE